MLMKRTHADDDRIPDLASESAHSVEADNGARIARLRALSGQGDSRGWSWNREEIYTERIGRNKDKIPQRLDGVEVVNPFLR